MRKLFLLLALIPFTAEARVDGRFVAFIGMIAVTDRVGGQVTDDDPQRLYALMNVIPKEENMGKGKAIKLPGKKFSIVCTDRGQNYFLCSVVVKAGEQGVVSPSKGVIRFVALGQEASDINKLFYPTGEGRTDYASVDGSLRISSDSTSFVAEYRKP